MAVMQKRLGYWLALASLPASPARIFRWLESVDDIELLFKVPATQLKHIGIPAEIGELLNNPSWQRISAYLTWAEESQQNHIVTYDDPCYPKLLKKISDPPLVLYVKGNLELLDSYQIAIVGSRNPTPDGTDIARSFAKHLNKIGLTITSGLALGIDTASHKGALESEKPKTIAVMGTGLDIIYPASNKHLAAEILANGGTLVSEYPPGTQAQAFHFPKRNRIISGLSLGTLVVEAALRSGSLITARQALDQNREVFAIPGSINNPLAKGCHNLIQNGAKLVESAEDIIEELGPIANIQENLFHQKKMFNSNIQSDEFLSGNESYQNILENLDVTATPIDILSRRTNLSVAEISSMLLVLELKGYVESAPSGYIKKQRTG